MRFTSPRSPCQVTIYGPPSRPDAQIIYRPSDVVDGVISVFNDCWWKGYGGVKPWGNRDFRLQVEIPPSEETSNSGDATSEPRLGPVSPATSRARSLLLSRKEKSIIIFDVTEP